ncbi:MAG: DUF6673 family protein [Schaedlerella sp.]|nr:DUF6673 family protein [Schaedlerella sp.]
MSLWKFNGFEAEADFTDADFLDKLFEAKKILAVDTKNVPKVGKTSSIVRAQCACFYNFFDNLFWTGAGEEIFNGRNSLALCIEAADSLSALEKSQGVHFEQASEKYQVQSHGNRQQRRAYQKNQRKQYPRK